tara:strand:+ start:556 stop:1830 length:1275 start_codon:yes stop_codon:yes gene_type:complete
MKVKQVKIDEISIGERFREDHGDIESLVSSIQEKGVLQPITVDGRLNLLAGERRIKASVEAGLTKIPAVIREIGEDVIEAKEIELYENIHRKDFTWAERSRLEQEIFNMKKEEDPNWTQDKHVELLGTSKGATSRRLQLAEAMEFIPELEECKTEDEAWKKYKRIEEEIVTQSLIQDADENMIKATKYAENHYKIRDCRAGLKEVKDGVIHFIEVDPPYGVELDKKKGRNQDLSAMDRYNEIEADDYISFIKEVSTECYRILYEPAFMIWWHGPTWYREVRETLREVGFEVSDIPAIWTKGQAGQTASPDTMLGSGYEPFFVCRKGSPKLVNAGRSNVFEFKPVAPQHKIHPTERPIELMQEILSTFTYPGARICVPFMGSGVTVRAAYKQKSVGFGWDLDEMTKNRFVNQVFRDAEDSSKGED